jgi:hypothetical protein
LLNIEEEETVYWEDNLPDLLNKQFRNKRELTKYKEEHEVMQKYVVGLKTESTKLTSLNPFWNTKNKNSTTATVPRQQRSRFVSSATKEKSLS